MDLHNPIDLDISNGSLAERKVEVPTIKSRRDRQFLPALPARVFVRLVQLPRRAWAVDRVARPLSRMRGTKPVPLSTCFLGRFGLTRPDKAHALSALERAGLIRVKQEPRRNPTVEILR
jgi:hypothetical protein